MKVDERIEMITLSEQNIQQKDTNKEALLHKSVNQQQGSNCILNCFKSLWVCCFNNKRILMQQEIEQQNIQIQTLTQYISEQEFIFQDQKAKDQILINDLKRQNQSLIEQLNKKSQKSLNYSLNSQICQMQLRVQSSQQQQALQETITSNINTYSKQQPIQLTQQPYKTQNNIIQISSTNYQQNQQNQQYHITLPQESQQQQQQQLSQKKNIKILGTVSTTQTVQQQPQSQVFQNQSSVLTQGPLQIIQNQSNQSQPVYQTQNGQIQNQLDANDPNESLSSVNSLEVLKTQGLQICYRCQTEISGSKIQTSCQHEYHEECFNEMIKAQVFNEELAAIQCVCKKNLKVQIIFNLSCGNSKEIQQKIYNNQIQIIKKNLSNKGRIQQCKKLNCNFFYISSKGEGSYCQNCGQ